MALSGEIQNEKFVNLRISQEEFLHLRDNLFRQVAMYYLEDDEENAAYDKKQIVALDAIFERMKQVETSEWNIKCQYGKLYLRSM